MQFRARLFGILAFISFLVAFIAFNLGAFGGRDVVYGTRPDGSQYNYGQMLLIISLWGSVGSGFFATLSWRNGSMGEQKRQHEESMTALKAIYRVLRIQAGDIQPQGLLQPRTDPANDLNLYDLTHDEKEIIRKRRAQQGDYVLSRMKAEDGSFPTQWDKNPKNQ